MKTHLITDFFFHSPCENICFCLSSTKRIKTLVGLLAVYFDSSRTVSKFSIPAFASRKGLAIWLLRYLKGANTAYTLNLRYNSSIDLKLEIECDSRIFLCGLLEMLSVSYVFRKLAARCLPHLKFLDSTIVERRSRNIRNDSRKRKDIAWNIPSSSQRCLWWVNLLLAVWVIHFLTVKVHLLPTFVFAGMTHLSIQLIVIPFILIWNAFIGNSKYSYKLLLPVSLFSVVHYCIPMAFVMFVERV